jgi:hypothetical protein
MSNNELDEIKPAVTQDYLLSHGFIRCSEIDEDSPYQMPLGNDDDFTFREKCFDRQMFVVIFYAYNGNPEEGYGKQVYVQENAGCGFIEIPFPWCDLPIEYFESVYYGIRGHKPIPNN